MRRIILLTILTLMGRCALAQTAGLYQNCQLTNQMGQAISGAQVYFLTQPANTSALTPLATVYTSSTESFTATQPLQTNGFGQCSAYLAAGTYTVCYVSPTTGQICNADQTVYLPGLPLTGGTITGNLTVTGTTTSTNDNSTTVNTTTVNATTGNYSGTVAAPASITSSTPFTDPRFYGAKCDGTTDDHAAFASAMTAMCATGFGGEMRLPPGTCYQGSTTLTIPCGGISISGFGNSSNQGTVLPASILSFAAGTSGIATATAVETNGLVLYNFGVKSLSTTSGSDIGVHIYTSNTAKMQRVQIYNFGNDCVYFDNTASATQYNDNFFDVRQNLADGCRGNGFHFNGSGSGNMNAGVVELNTSIGNTGKGYYFQNIEDDEVAVNNAYGNTGGDYVFSATLSNEIRNNYSEGVGNPIMTFDATSYYNKVWSPDFGSPIITDSGSGNDIEYFLSGMGQVYGKQLVIGPQAGSSGAETWAMRSNVLNNGDFDIYDFTTSTEWLDFNKSSGAIVPAKPFSTITVNGKSTTYNLAYTNVGTSAPSAQNTSSGGDEAVLYNGSSGKIADGVNLASVFGRWWQATGTGWEFDWYGSTSGAPTIQAYLNASGLSWGGGAQISSSSNVPQKVNTCGTTTTCSNTAQASPRIVWGTTTLSSGTATVSSMTAWTSTTSFVCTGTDTTAAAAVKITNASTSSITITGTSSDIIGYQCTGN